MADGTHIGIGIFTGLIVGGLLGWYLIAQPAFGAVAGGVVGLALSYLLDLFKN